MAKKNDLWDRSQAFIKCTVGTDPKKQNRFVMGLFIRTFASSGPDGKEKLPMGSIPGLCKNALLGLIQNGEIHLLWDCPYKLLC